MKIITQTLKTIKNLVGLFFPMPYKYNSKTDWVTSMSIGCIPVGWLFLGLAIFCRLIIK